MADSPNKKAHDLSTSLQDNGQEPSHPPTQIEDYEDISTYVVEAANGAPVFVPPSTEQRNFIIIMDDDHLKDISKEAFLQPNNGDQVLLPPTDINEEYTLSELFGDEESTLYSGTSLSLGTSRFEDPVLGAHSNIDSQPGNDNSLDIILENINWIELGFQYLSSIDDALEAVITKHQMLSLCDTKKMTNFQRITKQLLKLISVPQEKATVYAVLEKLCHPDVVRPHSVRAISDQQLIDIGVASKSKAMILLDLSKKYVEEAGDDKMTILLSDDVLNDLPDYEIYTRLQEIRGLEAYMAFTIMVFGLERVFSFCPNERELRLKYYRFNQQLQRLPWSGEAVGASNSWKPYKGLAAWIIWTHF